VSDEENNANGLEDEEAKEKEKDGKNRIRFDIHREVDGTAEKEREKDKSDKGEKDKESRKPKIDHSKEKDAINVPIANEVPLAQISNSNMSNSRERSKKDNHRRSGGIEKERTHVTTNAAHEPGRERDRERERRERGTSQERVISRRRSEKSEKRGGEERLGGVEREGGGLTSAPISPTNSDPFLVGSLIGSGGILVGENNKDSDNQASAASVSTTVPPTTIEKKKRDGHKSSERLAKRNQLAKEQPSSAANTTTTSQSVPSIVSSTSSPLSVSGGKGGIGIVLSGKQKPDVKLRVIDQNETQYANSLFRFVVLFCFVLFVFSRLSQVIFSFLVIPPPFWQCFAKCINTTRLVFGCLDPCHPHSRRKERYRSVV
jgi:hypothetical protein